jgi:hypothetical protein
MGHPALQEATAKPGLTKDGNKGLAQHPPQQPMQSLTLSIALAMTGLGTGVQMQAQAQAIPTPNLSQDPVCVMVASNGQSLDLGRLCGATPQRSAPRSLFVTTPLETNALRPPTLPILKPADLGAPAKPSYGVILLKPQPKNPVALGAMQPELAVRLGNASSNIARNVTVIYEISVPQGGGGFVAIGQGTKSAALPNLASGQTTTVAIQRSEVRDLVPVSFRSSDELAIRITALGWRDPDGKLQSFGPDSYRLARGIGQCTYPWELNARGQQCPSSAIGHTAARHSATATSASAAPRLARTAPLRSQ